MWPEVSVNTPNPTGNIDPTITRKNNLIIILINGMGVVRKYIAAVLSLSFST